LPCEHFLLVSLHCLRYSAFCFHCGPVPCLALMRAPFLVLCFPHSPSLVTSSSLPVRPPFPSFHTQKFVQKTLSPPSLPIGKIGPFFNFVPGCFRPCSTFSFSFALSGSSDTWLLSFSLYLRTSFVFSQRRGSPPYRSSLSSRRVSVLSLSRDFPLYC